MRRHKLISEIYKHCDYIGGNKTTVVFLLASMTDRRLTIFHEEFMKIKSYHGDNS